MPLPAEQQAAATTVINALYALKAKNRFLAEMFKELPDRSTWAEYYRVIPDPRALNNIKDKLEKGKYKDAGKLYTDVELVFANAIHFNEEHSDISNDARTLQGVLRKEWAAAVATGTLPEIKNDPEPESEPQPPAKAARPPALAARPPPKAPSMSLTPAPQPPQPLPQAAAVPHVPLIAPAPAPAPVLTPAPVSAPPPVADPDEDGTAGLVRDKQADELVRQLDSSLPRCPPPNEYGWLELTPGADLAETCARVLREIREYKHGDDRAAEVLDCLPDETTNRSLSFETPISIRLIEAKIKSGAYSSAQQFDIEMSRLFGKARRWHEEGMYSYGHVLVLQCLWQNLTSPGQEDMHVDVSSSSSLNSTTFKGITYAPGNWVHLANKDMPSKPIIAQVQSIENSGRSMSLTWYSRPEQTIHNPTRTFWEHEVFKTGYTSSSPVTAVIEPVACQFFPKHIRGRPSPPSWYPTLPLYVVESRYDPSSKTFAKVKNWASCVPKGIDPEGYMPIVKFASAKPIVPRKLPSPFLKGAAGTLARRRGIGGGGGAGSQKDRSVTAAVGGPSVVAASIVDVLPDETANHFDRDPTTNQLLWFSGAPIDPPHGRRPRHSLDYLYFLVRQRERSHRGEDLGDPARHAALGPPPLGEELAKVYHEVFSQSVDVHMAD